MTTDYDLLSHGETRHGESTGDTWSIIYRDRGCDRGTPWRVFIAGITQPRAAAEVVEALNRMEDAAAEETTLEGPKECNSDAEGWQRMFPESVPPGWITRPSEKAGVVETRNPMEWPPFAMLGSDVMKGDALWPSAWEGRSINDDHTHVWELVRIFEPGPGRGLTQVDQVVRCSIPDCHVPRCGHSDDPSPCVDRRHHDGRHSEVIR